AVDDGVRAVDHGSILVRNRGNDESAWRAVAISAAYLAGGAVSANRWNAARASARCPARPSAIPMLNSASYWRGSTATARFHISTARAKSFSRAYTPPIVLLSSVRG